MASRTTRIISDLHFEDNISWLQRLSSLRPLLEGTDEIILNGDALDTQIIANGPEKMAEMKAFFATHVAHHTFITGNHDPNISDLHELSLAEGLIWITHGDVLFAEMVPWSSKLPEIRRRLAPLKAQVSAHQFSRIETRLRFNRQISFKMPCDHDPLARGFLHRFYRLSQIVLHPGRALTLLRAWHDTPALAARLAAEQRQDARFILTGHTHFGGVWSQRNGRVVINTGSFCPPRGGLLVEIGDDHLRVRRILRQRENFTLGPLLASFPLAEKPV
jgi:predicted phosphodiesterase